jgi:methyl-accepting chemotaxis protein
MERLRAVLRDLSIRQKLLATVVLATSIALLLVFAFLLSWETHRSRESLVESTSTLAGVVGLHSVAPLLFDDRVAAEETLSALRAEPEVLAGAVYDADGRLFASYVRDGGGHLPETPSGARGFAEGVLELTRPIADGGQLLGTVLVRADTRGVAARTARYLGIAVVALGAALVIAVVVGSALQRSLTKPMNALLEQSAALTHGDLTRTLETDRADEIGVLARSFNDMRGSLRSLVGEIRTSVHAVGEACRELSSTSGDVVGGSRRQAQAVQDTGQAIGRVTLSITQVASGVEDVAATSRETSPAVSQLDASVARVAEFSDQLSTAIDGISAAINELVASVSQVTQGVSHLEDASTTAERSVLEQSRAIRRVRDNAQTSRELSQQNAAEAERGMRSVQETIGAIQGIESSFKHLLDVVDGLSGRSRSIGEIVAVIEDVASETQLLSLNAAIIASQAGENGRAFGVVAEQVKELAVRTAQSTRQIAELVKGIQEGTEAAVTAANEGATRVADGVARSNEAGDRLGAILEAARSSLERVDEIVQATESQTTDLSLVEEAVGQVREMVEQTHRAANEQDRATREIREMVERVRELGIEVRAVTQDQRRDSGRITAAIDQVAAMIEQIRGATQHQRTSSAEIESARAIFEEIAAENARRAETLGDIVAALTERAEQLSRRVDRFAV